jgi:hypothetical protein
VEKNQVEGTGGIYIGINETKTHPTNTKTTFSYTALPKKSQSYFVLIICGDSPFV